jgi:histidinol-phosphate aminotransferase
MNKKFKGHLLELTRLRTSLGRDMERGLCLDRNERVIPFKKNTLDAIRREITSAILSCYPEPAALYSKLSKWLKLPEEQIYITNGITEGMRVIYESLTNPGDEVVVIDPTFPMYRVYAKIYQTSYKPINFNKDLTFKIDDIYSAITKKTAFVCIPNPNLPIESYLNVKEIRRIAQKCKEHNVFLIVDEAYGFFGGESAISLIKEFNNVIVMQTYSKAFGLAGIRIGIMLSQPENITYLSKTRSLVEANGVSMAIASYMLDHLKVMKDYVRATQIGRDYLRRELDKLKIAWFGGNYTNAMLIFLKNEIAVKDVVSYLNKKKIYIRASFESPLDRCVRITLGPKKEMQIFLMEFKQWIKAHPDLVLFND